MPQSLTKLQTIQDSKETKTNNSSTNNFLCIMPSFIQNINIKSIQHLSNPKRLKLSVNWTDQSTFYSPTIIKENSIQLEHQKQKQKHHIPKFKSSDWSHKIDINVRKVTHFSLLDDNLHCIKAYVRLIIHSLCNLKRWSQWYHYPQEFYQDASS